MSPFWTYYTRRRAYISNTVVRNKHVHFGEERCWSCNGRMDGNLTCLPSAHIPRDIPTHEGPRNVLLGGHELHRSRGAPCCCVPLSWLRCTVLPVICRRPEGHGRASKVRCCRQRNRRRVDDKVAFIVGEVVGPLKGTNEPVIRHFETLVGENCCSGSAGLSCI